MRAIEIVDTASVRDLKEVVVEGKRAWVDGDKLIFLPSKRDKRLSNDIPSFLERMSIPTIRIDRGSIKSLRGQDVSIYINGVKAQEMDYATFWPKQTTRVEYLENPSDPRFNGEKSVINIVTKTPEYAVVGKVNAFQQIENTGRYSAATKTEKGKMTFGLIAGGNYMRDDATSGEETEEYSDVYFENRFYDKIRNVSTKRIDNKSQSFDIALNSRYLNGKTVIKHNAALKWTENPGSTDFADQIWNVPSLGNAAAASRTEGHTLTPQLTGSYKFTTSQTTWLSFGWKYAYAHNKSIYSYLLGDLPGVANRTTEDVHDASANATVAFNPSENFQIMFSGTTKMAWYRLDYTGTTDARSSQRKGNTTGTVNLWWQATPYVTVSVTPGVSADYWTSGGETYRQASPVCDGNISWYPSTKVFTNINVWYHRTQPSASATSDVLVRQTPLIWSQGNPAVKNNDRWSISPYVMWFPAKWLTVSNIFGINFENKGLITVYRSAPEELGGVIAETLNAKGFRSYTWDLGLSFTNILNFLKIDLSPGYQYFSTSESCYSDFGHFRMRGTVSGDIKNVNLAVIYDGREKFLSDAGLHKTELTDEWTVSASYGTGDFYFSASLCDIFHTHRRSVSSSIEGSRQTFSTMHTRGRCVRLTASYTFGFGRKTSNNIDVNRAYDLDSSIMKL